MKGIRNAAKKLNAAEFSSGRTYVSLDYDIDSGVLLSEYVNAKEDIANYGAKHICHVITTSDPLTYPEINDLISFSLYRLYRKEKTNMKGLYSVAQKTKQLADNGENYIQLFYDENDDRAFGVELKKGDSIQPKEGMVFVGFLREPWNQEEIADFIHWDLERRKNGVDSV